MAGGAKKVYDAFVEQIAAAGMNVEISLEAEGGRHPQGTYVSKSGCQGFCQMGPLVTVEPDGILYTRVKPEDVAEIVETTLKNREPVERLLYEDPVSGDRCRGQADIPFYKQQQRTVLKLCGRIDPEDIREYIHNGGYAAAKQGLPRPHARGDLRRDDSLRPAGTRRRRFSHGEEMGPHAPAAGREEVRHLQRRRRRSRGFHGPQRDGGQSAQRDRRHDDRRPGDRGRRGLRLRPRRISAGRAGASAARWRPPRKWACWATTSSARDSAFAST